MTPEENKFKEGSIWKTRGGHKAMILSFDHKSFNDPTKHSMKVWHDDRTNTVTWHNHINGAYADGIDNYDLITPWKDPVTVKAWVNVYGGGMSVFISEEYAKSVALKEALAIAVPLTWTEKDGIKQV